MTMNYKLAARCPETEAARRWTLGLGLSLGGGSSNLHQAGQHLPRAQKIRENAIRAGHARGQLPEPGISGEHVRSFAVPRVPACRRQGASRPGRGIRTAADNASPNRVAKYSPRSCTHPAKSRSVIWFGAFSNGI